MEDWTGFLVGMATGAIMSASITTSILDIPKRECEAELPRNVECVWTAPEVDNGAR